MARLPNLLLVLLLTLRSLLPVGFMLAVPQAGDGLVSVVICTAHGTEIVTLDRDGQPAPSQAPSSGDIVLCPYAPIGAVALADGAPSGVEYEAHFTRVAYAAIDVLAPAPSRLGSHSARGPPPTVI